MSETKCVFCKYLYCGLKQHYCCANRLKRICFSRSPMLHSPGCTKSADLAAGSQRCQVGHLAAERGGRGHLVLQAVELLLLRLDGEVPQVGAHLVTLAARVLAVLGRQDGGASPNPPNGTAGHPVAGGGGLRVRARLARSLRKSSRTSSDSTSTRGAARTPR